MRTHGPCASRQGKELGILDWPKTRRADSWQASESFASDRWQTEIVRRSWPTLVGVHAHARAVRIQIGERIRLKLACKLAASLRVIFKR